jgi:hypothetical protein
MEEALTSSPRLSTGASLFRELSNMRSNRLGLSELSLNIDSKNDTGDANKTSNLGLKGFDISVFKERIRKRKEGICGKENVFDRLEFKGSFGDVKSPEFKTFEDNFDKVQNFKKEKSYQNDEYQSSSKDYLMQTDMMSSEGFGQTLEATGNSLAVAGLLEEDCSFGVGNTTGKLEDKRMEAMNIKQADDLGETGPQNLSIDATPDHKNPGNSSFAKKDQSFLNFQCSFSKEQYELIKFPIKNSEKVTEERAPSRGLATASRALTFTGSKSVREAQKNSPMKSQKESAEASEGAVEYCKRLDGFLRRLEMDFFDLDREITKMSASNNSKNGIWNNRRESSPFLKRYRNI